MELARPNMGLEQRNTELEQRDMELANPNMESEQRNTELAGPMWGWNGGISS